MKLILENWRKYLAEGEDNFSYMSASPWGATEAEEEWGEEIKTALAEGDEHIGQRWPGLSEEVIEKAYPFLLSPESFANAVAAAPLKQLSLGEMKDIHNHAQVYDIIEMYENDKSPPEVEKEMFNFFKGIETDVGAGGKKYPKEQSYMRWVNKFKEEDSINKPPILLQLPNGGLAHVGGQTRQTGALTNQKIIPYAVLSPVKE
tara:strand:- start:543 stop:1151 length:609 start_codon:yes stop_codon:yes gene_type:complete